MRNLVLLGDSIFDNASYVSQGDDVCSRLAKLLPSDWRLTLVAEDGATTEDIENQLNRLPSPTTHLLLSIGGNDALLNSHIAAAPVDSAFEAFDLLFNVTRQFAANYRRVLRKCLAIGRPLAICTIYDGSFEEETAKRSAAIALAAFNDVIVREAAAHQLPVLDLRFVCTKPEHFTNSIEPSSRGSVEIAEAIAKAVRNGFRNEAAQGWKL